MNKSFFFDTYAIIEIMKGNDKYRFVYDSNITTSAMNLAETYYEMGDWLGALKAFDECVLLNPDDAASYYSKAKINFILSRTQEAVECLKEAFLLDPAIRSEFAKEYPEIKSSRLFKKLLGEL